CREARNRELEPGDSRHLHPVLRPDRRAPTDQGGVPMRRVSLLRRLHGDQRGITGVVTMVLMFVLLGIVAMAIDGGMLWRAHINIGNANDAAALAAAQEYATNGGCVLGATDPAVGQTGDGAAAGQANQAAQANVSTAAWDTRGEPSSPAYRVDRCQTNGTSGQVTVRYAYPKD